MKTIVAGTFDGIHKGHRALLDTAIKMAGDDSLCIGVTTNGMIHHKNHPVSPFKERMRDVFIYLYDYRLQISIIEINEAIPDKALDPNIECLVCSTETYKGALNVNYKRRMLDIPELLIVVVPVLYDYFGRKISTTNIYAGIIDGEGNKIHKMVIGMINRELGQKKAWELI